MPIAITCPECLAKRQVADEAAGTTVTCHECGAPIAVASGYMRVTGIPPPVFGAAGPSTPLGESANPAGSAPRGERPAGFEDSPRGLDDVPRRAGARRGKSGSAGVILLGVASLLVLSCVLCAGAGAIVGWYALMIPPAPPKKNPIAVAAKDFGKVMVKEGIKGAGKGPFGDAGMGAKDFGNGLKGGIPAGKIILNQAGRLMPNDPVKEFKPHKAHTVRLEQGKTYVIDMVSTEMDSYLRLYNPAGVKIAEDDDGGGFPNARIRIMATQAGSYQIDATVFGGVGVNGASYVLTVREE